MSNSFVCTIEGILTLCGSGDLGVKFSDKGHLGGKFREVVLEWQDELAAELWSVDRRPRLLFKFKI